MTFILIDFPAQTLSYRWCRFPPTMAYFESGALHLIANLNITWTHPRLSIRRCPGNKQPHLAACGVCVGGGGRGGARLCILYFWWCKGIQILRQYLPRLRYTSESLKCRLQNVGEKCIYIAIFGTQGTALEPSSDLQLNKNIPTYKARFSKQWSKLFYNYF